MNYAAFILVTSVQCKARPHISVLLPPAPIFLTCLAAVAVLLLLRPVGHTGGHFPRHATLGRPPEAKGKRGRRPTKVTERPQDHARKKQLKKNQLSLFVLFFSPAAPRPFMACFLLCFAQPRDPPRKRLQPGNAHHLKEYSQS